MRLNHRKIYGHFFKNNGRRLQQLQNIKNKNQIHFVEMKRGKNKPMPPPCVLNESVVESSYNYLVRVKEFLKHGSPSNNQLYPFFV